MKKWLQIGVMLFTSLFAFSGLAQAKGANNGTPHVKIETNMGEIVLELYPKQAPQTVANFLKYVNSGFYNQTIFHRVIKDFMIQGGGFTADYVQKQTSAPVRNEADNGLKNDRGTIAMARTMDPQSATAQFFINVNNNTSLNFSSKTVSGWGYTVFGRVIQGMAVVDKIQNMSTGSGGPFMSDVPSTPVVIEKVSQE